MKKEILIYINQHRKDMGLQPLKTNSIIEDEALTHSNNMAKGRVPFGHDGFDDRMGRIMKQIKPSHAAAENVAEGAKTAREVVDIWLHSPGHRKNIEGNYTLTGIGIAADRNGKLFFTQIFILNK
ncbi:MAG: CAP domain-containing protein [Flavipsychrobacter sp.]|nr:CAP domain-containing protein [Flavipsychrobacter sp.]